MHVSSFLEKVMELERDWHWEIKIHYEKASMDNLYLLHLDYSVALACYIVHSKYVQTGAS